MDIQDLFYTPQDIAKFIFGLNLGAKSQEPLISAVWIKEQAFIAQKWRKVSYKEFFQTVSRYLDGCVDVDDKKKDLAYLSNIHHDNAKINFSEDEYINDFSKLKFSFFKELRLKMMFSDGKTPFLYQFSILLKQTDYNLETLQKCLDFYRFTYTVAGKCRSLSKIGSSDTLQMSVIDGKGIYNDFMDFPKAEYQDDKDDDIAEDDGDVADFQFDTELLITAVDLQFFFKTMQIKQMGKNNQLQFINFLTDNYFEYLDISDGYLAALKIYEDAKRFAEFKWKRRKFELLKYIKLYTLRTGTYYHSTVSDLIDDVGGDATLEQLKLYLTYYGLVVFVGNDEADVETLELEQEIDIYDVSFLGVEDA